MLSSVSVDEKPKTSTPMNYRQAAEALPDRDGLRKRVSVRAAREAYKTSTPPAKRDAGARPVARRR